MGKRQADIADKQDRIMQQQLSKRAAPRVVRSMFGIPHAEGWSRYSVHVHNIATRTLRDYHWEVMNPESHKGACVLELRGGKLEELATSLEPAGTVDDNLFMVLRGFSTMPIHPGGWFGLGHVVIRHDVVNDMPLKWSVDCEDRVFPEPDGVGDVQVLYGGDTIN